MVRDNFTVRVAAILILQFNKEYTDKGCKIFGICITACNSPKVVHIDSKINLCMKHLSRCNNHNIY